MVQNGVNKNVCVLYKMSLYVANLMESAKPVKEKVKGKKVVEQVLTPPESVSDDVPEIVLKEKKPRSDKQIAAFERAKETRRLKKEDAEKLILEKEQDELKEKERQEELYKLKQEKLEIQREKRKAKKDISLKVDEVVLDEEPPKWFKKYMTSVKMEENLIKSDRQPVKKVKLDAQETAHKEWQNGLTRDRVRNEIDGHMSRMYSQIFGR